MRHAYMKHIVYQNTISTATFYLQRPIYVMIPVFFYQKTQMSAILDFGGHVGFQKFGS